MKTTNLIQTSTIRSLFAAAMVAVVAAFGATPAEARVLDTDVMGEGQVTTYTVTLAAGELMTYSVEGDDDALDIDIEVFDPYGNKVAWDYMDDAVPVASFVTLVPGTYTIRVIMVDTYFGRPAIFALHGN